VKGFCLGFMTALLLLATSPSHAAVVDFAAAITDESGEPYQHCQKWKDAQTCESLVPLTLGIIAITALNTRFEDEKNLSGMDQVKRGALAFAIHKTPQLDIDSTQNDLIRRLAAKLGYKSFIVFQAWKLLDPASVK
jgi:hypothetical protein